MQNVKKIKYFFKFKQNITSEILLNEPSRGPNFLFYKTKNKDKII